MPVIVATITPKPDKIDAVEEVLTRLIPEVHTEDGCEPYALHKDKDRFVFLEKGRDMAALGAHGGGANIKPLNAGLEGLVAGAPDVMIPGGCPRRRSGEGHRVAPPPGRAADGIRGVLEIQMGGIYR